MFLRVFFTFHYRALILFVINSIKISNSSQFCLTALGEGSLPILISTHEPLLYFRSLSSCGGQ